MKTRIRKGVPADAAAFVAIKEHLPFSGTAGTATQGGFLLGTDEQTYAIYIANSFCLVAEIEGQVVGFGIAFDDAMLRQSDVWQRRDQVQWTIDITSFENRCLGYFEQLAFLKGHSRLALQLAYNLTKWVFDTGVSAIFTTTVREPVKNLAAVPYILGVGGVIAGSIDETYPGVGRIKSDIYLMEASTFKEHIRTHPLRGFLKDDAQLSV